MKKIVLIILALLGCWSIQAQLLGIVIEAADDGSVGVEQSELGGILCPEIYQPEGMTTYRVFAQLQDPDDFLSAIFAIPGMDANPDCYPLEVTTTTNFFNSPIGHVDGAGIIEAACGAFPDVYWDSFMTIGKERSDDPGNVGNSWSDGNPFTSPLSTASIGNVYATDGAMFATTSEPNGYPTGPQNLVLLGQFTTNGELHFKLNINVFDGGDGTTGNLLYLAYELDNVNCPVPGTAFDGRNLGLIYNGTLCGDPSACNYNPDLPETDTETCCYGTCGCSDENATNYNPDVTCPNFSSCEYQSVVFAYIDENGNGIQDIQDLPLEGAEVFEDGQLYGVTDENGELILSYTGQSGTIEVAPHRITHLRLTYHHFRPVSWGSLLN